MWPKVITRFVERDPNRKEPSFTRQEVEISAAVIYTFYCPRCKAKTSLDRCVDKKPRKDMICVHCGLKLVLDEGRWIVA